MLSGLSALIRFEIYGFYAFTFWIAAIYIKEGMINERSHEPYTVGEVLIILISMMMGLMGLMSLNPNI